MNMITIPSKLMQKIAVRDIKNNKVLNVLLIVSIFLSGALLMGALLLSGQMKKMNIINFGSWHAMYQNASQEIVDPIASESSIASYGVSAFIEEGYLGDKKLNITYADTDAMNLTGLTISEGYYPESVDEILLEQDFRDENGRLMKAGDTITLEIPGNYDSGGKSKQVFRVSGTFRTVAANMNRTIYGAMVSEAYFDKRSEDKSIPMTLFVSLGNSTDQTQIEAQLAMISEKYATDNTFSINKSYFQAKEQGWLYTALALGLSIVILLLAYFTIYCIFFISVVNSVRDYGQLQTLGVTNKQINTMTKYKFGILTGIGLPLGILFGAVTAYLLIPETFSFQGLWLDAVIVSATMILIIDRARRKPLKIIHTMSLIDAKGYNGIEFIKPHKNICRITPYSLAGLYIKRYRKKVNLTITLLALSGSVFLIVASVLSSMDAVAMSKGNFPEEDYHLCIENSILMDNSLEIVQMNNPLKPELINDLNNMGSIIEVWNQLNLPFSKDEEENGISGAIVSINKREYETAKKILISGTLPEYDDFSVNDIIVGRPDDFEADFGFKPQYNSTISLQVYQGNHKQEQKFRIVGVLDQKSGVENRLDELIMPYDSMLKFNLVNLNYQILIQSDGSEAAEQQLIRLITKYPGIRIDSLRETIEQNEMFLYSFKSIIYIILFLLTIFSVLNLFNTLLTNTIVRKSEFEAMQTIGMTWKQLRKVLTWEGEIIVLRSLFLIGASGLSIGWLICALLTQGGFSFINYQFPFMPVMICIISEMVVAFVSTWVIGIRLITGSPDRKEKVERKQILLKK